MAIAALLHPQIAQAQLTAEAISPEEVRPALIHGDDVFRVDGRTNPLHLAPDGAAIGIARPHVARVEKLLPLLRRAVAQRLHIMRHFQERAAFFAAIHHFVQGVALVTTLLTLKPGLITHDSAPSPSPRRGRCVAVAGGSVELSIHARSPQPAPVDTTLSSENVALRASATGTSDGITSGPSGVSVLTPHLGNAAIGWRSRQVVNDEGS